MTAEARSDRQAAQVPGPRPAGLSAREYDVLRLAAWGYSLQMTADALGIARTTVAHHRALALRRLGVNDEGKYHALWLAFVQLGWLIPPSMDDWKVPDPRRAEPTRLRGR